MQNGDLTIVKLNDGTFAIGKYASNDSIIEEVNDERIEEAYILILSGTPTGEVRVMIADFMAPFIQDKQGTTFRSKDWIGQPFAMPIEIQQDYMRRRTGIVITNQMPNGSNIIL
jgi:hypothetical protein